MVLTHDIEDRGLKAGDIGIVINCYEDKKEGFEIEFVTADGKTIAVLMLTIKNIQPFDQAEILHVRDVTSLVA